MFILMKINYYQMKNLDKIEELSNKINYDNLKCIVKSSANETGFTKAEDPIAFLNNITKKIAV